MDNQVPIHWYRVPQFDKLLHLLLVLPPTQSLELRTTRIVYIPLVRITEGRSSRLGHSNFTELSTGT